MPRESRLVLIACYLGDLRHRREQHGDHGGAPRHVAQPRPRSRGRGMDGQRLSAGSGGLHHPGRPGRGRFRAAAFLRRRDRLVRSRLADHRARRPTACVLVAARALQGLGAAFAVAGTLAAVTPGRSRSGTPERDRRLDGIPDAGLQHRSAAGRGRHPLRRLAHQFLAESAGHASGGLGALALETAASHAGRALWTGSGSSFSSSSW